MKASSSSSSPNTADQRLQKIEKNSPTLRGHCNVRDPRKRRPRHFLHLKVSLHSQHHPPPQVEAEDEGKARKAKAEVNKGSKGGPQAPEGRVDQIWENVEHNRQFFHKTQNRKGVCYSFQKGQDHCCLGCGKANVQGFSLPTVTWRSRMCSGAQGWSSLGRSSSSLA